MIKRKRNVYKRKIKQLHGIRKKEKRKKGRKKERKNEERKKRKERGK